jgi:hypothetical protein
LLGEDETGGGGGGNDTGVFTSAAEVDAETLSFSSANICFSIFSVFSAFSAALHDNKHGITQHSKLFPTQLK